jgi:hypothetical protein
VYVGDDTSDGPYADGYTLRFCATKRVHRTPRKKKGAQREERYPKSPDHMTSSENEIDESRPLITAREIHGTLKWTERKPNPKLTRKRATAWSNQQHEMDNDTREKTGLKIHAAK